MPDNRRYSEAELKVLFERAAARQEAARPDDDLGSLTLEEAQRIAADSGIDPVHLAAVAAELDLAPPESEKMLGMPVEVTRTRVLPGPVSDTAWARMVAELRRHFKNDGAVGEVGGVREWTFVGRGLRRDLATRFTMEPLPDGTTRLVLRQSMREFARLLALSMVLYVVMALIFGGLALAGVDPAEMWSAVLATLSMGATTAGFTYAGFGYWDRRQRRTLENAMDRLELIARSTMPAADTVRGRTPEPTPTRTPDLDLDALPDAPDATSTPSDRSRTAE